MLTLLPDSTLEILAPAGDFEMLRAAVFSGADCVYVGVEGFNARRSAANFGPDELAEAVQFCHARGCKVYAALNTLVQPQQMSTLADAVLDVARAGCDAVIVQDLATAALVRALAPEVALHASTQMSVHSLEGVRALSALGFSRAILARELSGEEIGAIAQDSPIELEVFVHGALCVSVSGQCMMSSFFGGRSANRGACAGPCRLPFQVEKGVKTDFWGKQKLTSDAHLADKRAPQGCHHLSMKDLSILDALPRLAEMGVVSAKIEGRLRGPEYCAFVVDCARKSLRGEKYDKDMLGSIFSRSGFTDGWFAGRVSADMFGARTAQDSAASKKALPAARALYRREMPRVAVELLLVASAGEATLTVTDGVHTVRRLLGGLLVGQSPAADAPLRAALAKMGGTPFYAASEEDICVDVGNSAIAAPQAAALRRDVLEELLALRSAPHVYIEKPLPTAMIKLSAPALSPTAEGAKAAAEYTHGLQARRADDGRPMLRARFRSVAQMPGEAAELCGEFLFPLCEAGKVPVALRPRSWLRVPRVLFGGDEARACGQIDAAREMGFLGFQAQNIAHLGMCRGALVSCGFGLNVANAVAAATLGKIAGGPVTLSPELTLRQMGQIVQADALSAIVTDCLCYGHLPLMLTRACPLQNTPGPGAGGCKNCDREGQMIDRKGAAFRVKCTGPNGARSIYNPVPLWMGDELAALPTHTATLYFTHESPQEAAQVLRDFCAGLPSAAPFTRGLYARGTAD